MTRSLVFFLERSLFAYIAAYGCCDPASCHAPCLQQAHQGNHVMGHITHVHRPSCFPMYGQVNNIERALQEMAVHTYTIILIELSTMSNAKGVLIIMNHH